MIEETGRPTGLIFAIWGYLKPGSEKFEFCHFFHIFDGVMTYTHIFESVKNHINADISHPIRDRHAKT